MRLVSRSLVGSVVVVLGLGLAACGSKETAGPEASASGSGAAAKTLAVAPKKIPADVLKTFRADSCYFGALALLHAKEAYLGSLGDGEPAEGKIPEFGLLAIEAPPAKEPPAPAASGAAPAASGAASAKPATSAKPAGSAKPATAPPASAKPATGGSAKPAAGPSASAGRPLLTPPNARAQRTLPYERFIRSCNVVTTLKDPASPDYDATVKAFADYALPLTKSLQDASAYYQKEEYKNDGFAKGKEYHKTIVDGFAKLDEQVKKLKEATDKFEKASPVAKTDWEEGQKLGDQVVADANALVAALGEVPMNVEAAKAAYAKLEADQAALKKYGEDNKDKKDPWASLVPAPTQQLLDQAKPFLEGEAKPSAGKLVELITVHSRVLETNHRALTRKNATEAAGARGIQPNQRLIKPKMPANHPQ